MGGSECCQYLTVVLICISLKTHSFEHLPTYFLASLIESIQMYCGTDIKVKAWACARPKGHSYNPSSVGRLKQESRKHKDYLGYRVGSRPVLATSGDLVIFDIFGIYLSWVNPWHPDKK